MSILSLLTDFGLRDEYVGVVKGVILKINPQAKIVDLTHEIPPQDITWAAYCLASVYKFFPKGTIFLCIVDPGVGSRRKIVIVKTKNYYFVCPDNGILTKVLENERAEKIIEAKNRKFFLSEISSTFHGRDILAPVAAYISQGIALSEFGPVIKGIKQISLPKIIVKEGKLFGEIIHIDHFGNLTINIDKNLFNTKKGQALFSKKGQALFVIQIKDKKILRINTSYAASKKGEILAIWGSRDFLEISVNQGNAQRLLKVNKGEKLYINFS